MSKSQQTVVVLGASPKPERYSNQAVGMLVEYGYTVIPVNPSGINILNLTTVKKLEDIKVPVGTLTVYVGAKISSGLQEAIVLLKPERVIFNPGAENPELEKMLAVNKINIVHACTLVLLRTEQF
jgi:predicted CoA-binding protein